MTREEMNKDKAEVLKMVFEYKNYISTLKDGIRTSNIITDSMMRIGLRDDSSITLKNACIELGIAERDRLESLILSLIDTIDSIGDSLIDAYSEGIKGIETED